MSYLAKLKWIRFGAKNIFVANILWKLIENLHRKYFDGNFALGGPILSFVDFAGAASRYK